MAGVILVAGVFWGVFLEVPDFVGVLVAGVLVTALTVVLGDLFFLFGGVEGEGVCLVLDFNTGVLGPLAALIFMLAGVFFGAGLVSCISSVSLPQPLQSV